MKKQLVLLIFLTLVTVNNIKAQSFSFTFNPDPYSLAAGWGGVANTNSGPGNYLTNPALLGYFSQETNFSYQAFAEIPQGSGNNTNCFTLGYKFPNVAKGLDISAGLGYRRISQSSYYSFEKLDAYTIGLSLDYFVNLSLGITFKKGSTDYASGTIYNQDEEVKARDWGLLVTVPVLKLIDPDLTFKPGTLKLKPFANISIGYSRSNIGDDRVSPGGYKSPLPLTADLGYNLSLGSDILLPEGNLQLFDISLMIESEDNLVEYNENGEFHTQTGIGDIKIGENLLKWKGTENVYVSKGKSISLLETVTFLRGSYEYSASFGFPTYGYDVSTGGIFKILSMYVFNDNNYAKYLLNHLEFNYVKAAISSEDARLTLSTFSVSVKNLSL